MWQLFIYNCQYKLQTSIDFNTVTSAFKQPWDLSNFKFLLLSNFLLGANPSLFNANALKTAVEQLDLKFANKQLIFYFICNWAAIKKGVEWGSCEGL